MKILFFSSIYPHVDDPVGGIFVHEQVKALKMSGVEVTVLVPNYPHPTRIKNGRYKFRNAGLDYTLDSISVKRFPIFPIPKIHYPFTRFAVGRALRANINVFGKPDLVHSHFVFYGGVAGEMAAAILGVPHVLSCHSSKIALGSLSTKKTLEARDVMSAADRVVSVSDFLGEKIRNIAPSASIVSIPNTVDTGFFAPISLEGPGKEFTFTCIGSLRGLKRIDNLIRAFSQIINKGGKNRLVIVGDGQEAQSLQNLVTGLGIQEYVRFIGWVSRKELVKIINQSHAVVSASDVETFGVSLIESLACGVPILATRSGGPEEIVTPDNGILVEKGNVEALAEGMKRMVQEYTRFDRKKIREDCIAKYGYAAVAEKLIATYKDVLAKN